MINAKFILPVVLALVTSFTSVSAATSAETGDTDIRSAISVQCEEALSEKLESGKISQEKYDEIIAAIEAGEFRSAWGNIAMRGKRGNAVELTEEQKAELSARRAEMLDEKLAAGEITQEQYDEIIAAIESGDFIGNWANRGKIGELTEEQKAEIAEKRNEFAENGRFGGIWGKRGNAEELTEEQKAELAEKWSGVSENGRFGGMWVNRGNAKELTDEQKTEIAEKQAEAAANGNFGGFRGGMRGNFGSRNK